MIYNLWDPQCGFLIRKGPKKLTLESGVIISKHLKGLLETLIPWVGGLLGYENFCKGLLSLVLARPAIGSSSRRTRSLRGEDLSVYKIEKDKMLHSWRICFSSPYVFPSPLQTTHQLQSGLLVIAIIVIKDVLPQPSLMSPI